MLTLHIGADQGVLVDGELVAAVGPAAELEAAYPAVRVRRWRGTLGPGRLHRGPLPDAPSARERVHALLRTGATAACPEHLADPELRTAASRNGLAVADRDPVLAVGGRADLAVFAEDGACLATVLGGRLVHRRA
ncbi:imidazolonepropionase-like domain-containing protein [Streptacidiphilus cavernicola]|uniref:Aminodeoxyfutalosine deaminase/Imidazolonepropionase-like composite domain-containing protein n=1 Tax=Streptacidiphilus cavernicola TaxID=3342716 RepID=A0ABV6W2H8_9ACTN